VRAILPGDGARQLRPGNYGKRTSCSVRLHPVQWDQRFAGRRCGPAVGLHRKTKDNLSLEALRELIADGHSPIVFVDLRPIDGVRDSHAMVILSVGEQEIAVLDSLVGERTLPLRIFDSAWTMALNLTILVQQ